MHWKIFTFAIVLSAAAGVLGEESYEDYDDDYYPDGDDLLAPGNRPQLSLPDSPTATELPELQLEDLTTPLEPDEDDDDEYDYDDVEVEKEPNGPNDAIDTLPTTVATTIKTLPTTTTPSTTTTRTTEATTTTTTKPTTTTTTATTTKQIETNPPPAAIHSPIFERGDQSPATTENEEVPELQVTTKQTTSRPTTTTARVTTTTTTRKITTRKITTPSTTRVQITTTRGTRPSTKSAEGRTVGTSVVTKTKCPSGWSFSSDRVTKVQYCVKTIECTLTCIEDALDACNEVGGQLETPIPRLRKQLDRTNSLKTVIKCKRHPVFCCNPGWSIFCIDDNSCSCYKRYDDKAKHWKKGNNCCRKLNATLVTIEDDRENRFLAEFARQTVSNSHELVWLGIKSLKASGSFESVIDDTPKYFNWANDAKKDGECVAMATRSSKWTYLNCYKPHSVICEGNPYLWMNDSPSTTTENNVTNARRRRNH